MAIRISKNKLREVLEDMGVKIPTPEAPDKITDDMLPNLTHNKIWMGDAGNRPAESDPPKKGIIAEVNSHTTETPITPTLEVSVSVA